MFRRWSRPRTFLPRTFLIAASLVVTGAAGTTSGQQPHTARVDPWPGFRGPNVDGATHADEFPRGADLTLEIAWKRPIGSGYSAIAVGDDLLVTMFADGESDVIAAFDPTNGGELWRVPIGESYKGHDGSFNGPISTPLVHGKWVIGLSPRGRLFALDRANGETLWSIDLVERYGAVEPDYGFGTSPILTDGTLMVQIGGTGAAIAGLDPPTGRVLWTAGDDTMTYQSPVPMTIDGRPQVVATGVTEMLGLDPQSGEVLWRFEHGGTGYLGAQSLVPVSVDNDRVFLAFKDEASTVVGLDPSHPDSLSTSIWESRTIRNSYQVPVYHKGYVFGFSSRFLTAVDARTGEPAWKSRPPGDGFPILVGDDMVILTKNGSLHIIEARPDQYREKAALQVFDEHLAWSPPSFAFGSIFVRSLGELARIDIRPTNPATELARVAFDESGEAPAGSAFAGFLGDVAALSDKSFVIDEYLAAQSSFPIIEGRELVHFVYRGPGQDVALAGDLVASRQEVPMRRVEGTDLFVYTARLEPDARINYRFIRDFEEILDPLNDRETVSDVYGVDMELTFDGSVSPMSWLAMPDWRSPPHLEEPPPATPRGRLVERTFASDALGASRTVQVYLPPGYDDGDERYPVAYYHGGAAARSIGWIPASLDNLIASGQRPVIAVFMDRAPFAGITYPIRSILDAYAKMWAHELVPLIDESFRTIAEPHGRAALGGGRDAYLAAYATLQEADVVSKIGLQSIHMNTAREQALDEVAKAYRGQPLDIYVDWGAYDAWNPQENWDHRPRNRNFAALMRELGHNVSGGEVHDGTGWSSWRNRTDIVYRTLFDD